MVMIESLDYKRFRDKEERKGKGQKKNRPSNGLREFQAENCEQS